MFNIVYKDSSFKGLVFLEYLPTYIMENDKRQEWTIRTKRFKHKKTGEIKTQISIMELSNYEEIIE